MTFVSTVAALGACLGIAVVVVVMMVLSKQWMYYAAVRWWGYQSSECVQLPAESNGGGHDGVIKALGIRSTLMAGKMTRQTEEEVGSQHQGMDRPGVRQVPEGSGEQGKMEKTG